MTTEITNAFTVPTLEQIEAEYARVRDTWDGMTWDSDVRESGRSWAYAGRQHTSAASRHRDAIRTATTDEQWEAIEEVEADDVAAQAARAELRAAEAMASVRAGDWAEAERSIDGAAQIEREYGDDPTWGRLARMIALAAKAQ